MGAMSRLTVIAVSALVITLITGLISEHQARTALSEDLASVKAEAQRLAQQVAVLQREQSRTGERRQFASAGEQSPELARLRALIGELHGRLSELERASAAFSNAMAAAKPADVPFVYPDATRRADYAFKGYHTPQAALQSVLWTITQLDARTHQASLTGPMADTFATAIEDLPEGVMPGGYKNGAMYRATGYRILEETPLSDEELLLKVFLEGAQIVIKPVFKLVDGEWKWARNAL